ncbi:FAD-dependent oxidoreductase [Sulfurovum sp.]|uniref:FAD-dependent oxidoreductase n=1 Tax=Sulfurovum sp. TaxID=1969726 RepID=UPI0025F71602|nr:FAD-dependent oxidoreductase [Sulfurovum sp.]
MRKGSYYTQVAIIGGGISGAALLFMLSRYTQIESVMLFEKYGKPATLNSSAKANSQTLHIGDIETNYDFGKAKKVSTSSSMVANFITHFNYEGSIGFRKPKMVLAVGEEEIAELKKRYSAFKTLFPYLELWDKGALEEIEPMLTKGRKEPILAMGTKDKITTVDFEKLSQTFIELSKDEHCAVDLKFNTEVTHITKKWDKFLIHTDKGEFMSDAVVVNAGAHSLLLAHEMGYGDKYAMLPIGGSFYFAKTQLLHAKVYTMQNPKLPFAAVHGDPDLTANWRTRFGPTAFAMMTLERYHDMEILNLFDLLSLDRSVLGVYYDLMKDEDIRAYIMRNFVHELPHIGNEFFIKEVRKLIPTLSSDDIEYADGYGGMRPQIIDKKAKKLLLGEAKIDTGKGIIFNMTPSPGASSCLGNAFEDAKILCDFLGVDLLKRKIKKELCDEKEYCYINRQPHR